MARTIRNTKLDTRSGRASLTMRREPFWTVIAGGCAVGYRKGKKGGTWVARWRAPDGKQHYNALGPADDAMDADGLGVLSFSQAQEMARTWFAEQAAGGREHTGPYTVREAIHDYLAWMESEGKRSVKDSRTRAEALILLELGDIEVSKLAASKIREWRDALARAAARTRTRLGDEQRYRNTPDNPESVRQRRSTANRTLTILKAALNHAFNEGRVDSDLVSAGALFQEDIRRDVSQIEATAPNFFDQFDTPTEISQRAARRRQAQGKLMSAASVLLLPPILAFALGWAGFWIMKGFRR